MKKERLLVTSALPYANGPIHLGHLSGAYLPADIFVRYQRLKGQEVLFVCGSDEHGVPITITAEAEGVSPKEIIDRYHGINKEAFKQFGMSFDIYSRTSTKIHENTAKEFFLNFYNQGILKEKKSLQFYDQKAGMFLPDRYVEGTCPKCGNLEARSDECEKCGSLYDPSELVDPKSKITGERPVLKETTHFFFPLGKYQKRLEDYVSSQAKKYGWKDNVLQYCRGWFREGLRDRAVTRDLDWGIEVPLDKAQGKVLYVWFEAVLGYISATKEIAENLGRPSRWKDFWLSEDTRYIAFIGKDNIVFHTIIFPAMLMAWNDVSQDKYILPENVPANEFLNFEGKKFSKSRNWGIDVIDFLKLYPADSLRYCLAANLPESKDTDFYWKEFQARNNSELADILGNFINRSFIFAHKYFDGKVPEMGPLGQMDQDMLEAIKAAPERVGSLIEKYKIKDAVFEMMVLARKGNKYFNDSEPWKSIKTDPASCATTINICLKTIYCLAGIFSPVIPFTTEKIFSMLNLSQRAWGESPDLEPGHQILKAEILFRKIDDDEIEVQTKAMAETEVLSPAESKTEIGIDDFSRIEIKVGILEEAEKIKKSKKLLLLKVNLGSEIRQIVSGIASSYNAEELPGKKILVVSNLKPVTLFGYESHGMVLAAEGKNGAVCLLEAPEGAEAGSIVR